MFKPGEIAKVRQHRGTVVILAGSGPLGPDPDGSDFKWGVLTDKGAIDEERLSPAHPSVLATVEGRDLSVEAYDERIERMVKVDDESGMSFDQREEVEEALKAMPFDPNNHWKSGTALDSHFKALEHLFLSRSAMSKADAEDMLRAAQDKKPLDRWIPVELRLSSSGLRACSCCGEGDFSTETNGVIVRIAGKSCEFPDGLPPTMWELNVPSGKIVVANDLRELFPTPEDEEFDINTAVGCRKTALAYAANGMSHAYIGNSCPSVYQCGEGVFKIANPPRGEEWDGKNWVKVKPAPKFEGKEVAGIDTELWWYSICDHAEYKRRLKHFKLKGADFDAKTVKVKPGVYRFTHNERVRRDDGQEERVYTRFEWIREPDPVRDLIARYEEVEVNPNAYVQAQVARWPTLYGQTVDQIGGKEKAIPWADMTEADRFNSWQRVADHTFCTIGGGVSWHPKGFPTAKVDPNVPDVEPPSFRAQYHWYPFSKPYGGLFEPETLSPPFAKLAFRILESVISFGMVVRDGEHSRDVPYVRERMLVAVKRYRELAKKHPDQADPEYVEWLSQEGRAEAWVEKFDLGPTFTEKHRKHVQRQRWVPEDAYAVEFDARKLKDGHFAHDPKVMGGWAHKKDAKRYAINAWEDNKRPPEHNCFWTCHAVHTAIPLYSVARVVKVGEVSHMGETLIELAFDYGTPWMRDPAKRKALAEMKEKAGIRVLSRAEYEELLPKATEFYETPAKRSKKSSG